jgi:hypothetical protein
MKNAFMLWTTLRWNSGNTAAVAAFCLLPVIGFANGSFSDRVAPGPAPIVELQVRDFKLTALPAECWPDTVNLLACV